MGALARPDRRVALPQVLATVGFNRSERSASRAQCHTNRTVIKNKLHGNLLLHISSCTIHCERRAFSTKVMRRRRTQKNNARQTRQANWADRKLARAPLQKREPSIEKLQNAEYRQERSTQAQQANVLSEQLAVPERFATTAVTPQAPSTSASVAQRRPVTRFGKTA